MFQVRVKKAGFFKIQNYMYFNIFLFTLLILSPFYFRPNLAIIYSSKLLNPQKKKRSGSTDFRIVYKSENMFF